MHQQCQMLHRRDPTHLLAIQWVNASDAFYNDIFFGISLTRRVFNPLGRTEMTRLPSVNLLPINNLVVSGSVARRLPLCDWHHQDFADRHPIHVLNCQCQRFSKRSSSAPGPLA